MSLILFYKSKGPSNSCTHANQELLSSWTVALSMRVIFPDGLRPLGLFAFAESFTSYEFEFSGEGAGEVVGLARLSAMCRKLQSIPFGHYTMAVHCQQSHCPLRTWRCSLGFLTSMFDSILQLLASIFLVLRFFSILLLAIVLNWW